MGNFCLALWKLFFDQKHSRPRLFCKGEVSHIIPYLGTSVLNIDEYLAVLDWLEPFSFFVQKYATLKLSSLMIPVQTLTPPAEKEIMIKSSGVAFWVGILYSLMLMPSEADLLLRRSHSLKVAWRELALAKYLLGGARI